MAAMYEYVLSLQDRMSGSLQRIAGASQATVGKLSALSAKNDALKNSTRDLGVSMSTLKQKIDLLQAEKELLPSSALRQIGTYNREIDRLNGKIGKLESAGRGGALKKAFGQIDSATGGLMSNPLVLGTAAVGATVGSAMNFREGMAKVNITAQLDEKSLAAVSERVKKITKDNKADITLAPVGFEKIISQVGEVETSLQILNATQKGAKAAFVDQDTVAGALAQTLSIVGKENTTAQEVLDTFLASKRVGAGEFKDFAQYMPNLIAGASNLGIAYKDVAGVYAYMTGKGQSAERAAVLMENAFSVLGRGEVQDAMKKAGVQIFDTQGKMRSMVDIAKDLNKVMGGRSDKQKSNILEGMGLRDKEAKNAFAILMSDVGKLENSMNEVRNSTGETEKTLAFSANPIQKAAELWSGFKLQLVDLGENAIPLVNVALEAGGYVLTGLSAVISGVVSFFGGWFGMLSSGNPLIWGLTAALGAAAVAVNWNTMMLAGAAIATKAKLLWDGLATTATAVWTGTQWGLNAALFACPITWIVAGIGLLVGGIVWAWNKFEGFRQVVMGVWECIKMLGQIIIDNLVGVIGNAIKGIGSLGKALWKVFTGDFKGAWQSAKEGAQSLVNANPIVAGVKMGAQVAGADWSGAYQNGAQKGADSWARSQEKKTQEQNTLAPGGMSGGVAGLTQNMLQGATAPGTAQAPGGESFDRIMAKLDKGGKGGNGSGSGSGTKQKEKDTFDLNNIGTHDLKGSTAYNAIVSKLAPVKMAGLAAAVATGMALAPSPAPASTTPDTPAPVLTEIPTFPPASAATTPDTPIPILAEVPTSPPAAIPNTPTPVTVEVPALPSASVTAMPGVQTPTLAEVPTSPATAIPNTPTSVTVEVPASPSASVTAMPGVQTPTLAEVPIPPATAIPNTPTPVTVETLAIPTASDAAAAPAIGLQQDDPKTDNSPFKRSGTQIGKFCDSVIINIAHADGKGYDQIKDEIMREMLKVFDNYEA